MANKSKRRKTSRLPREPLSQRPQWTDLVRSCENNGLDLDASLVEALQSGCRSTFATVSEMLRAIGAGIEVAPLTDSKSKEKRRRAVDSDDDDGISDDEDEVSEHLLQPSSPHIEKSRKNKKTTKGDDGNDRSKEIVTSLHPHVSISQPALSHCFNSMSVSSMIGPWMIGTCVVTGCKCNHWNGQTVTSGSRNSKPSWSQLMTIEACQCRHTASKHMIQPANVDLLQTFLSPEVSDQEGKSTLPKALQGMMAALTLARCCIAVLRSALWCKSVLDGPVTVCMVNLKEQADRRGHNVPGLHRLADALSYSYTEARSYCLLYEKNNTYNMLELTQILILLDKAWTKLMVYLFSAHGGPRSWGGATIPPDPMQYFFKFNANIAPSVDSFYAAPVTSECSKGAEQPEGRAVDVKHDRIKKVKNETDIDIYITKMVAKYGPSTYLTDAMTAETNSSNPLLTFLQTRWRETVAWFVTRNDEGWDGWNWQDDMGSDSQAGRRRQRQHGRGAIVPAVLALWRQALLDTSSTLYSRAIPCPSAIDLIVSGAASAGGLDQCILEIGGNLGYWSRAIAARGVAVRCFDPSPVTPPAKPITKTKFEEGASLKSSQTIASARQFYRVEKGSAVHAIRSVDAHTLVFVMVPPSEDVASAVACFKGQRIACVVDWVNPSQMTDHRLTIERALVTGWVCRTTCPLPNWNGERLCLSIWERPPGFDFSSIPSTPLDDIGDDKSTTDGLVSSKTPNKLQLPTIPKGRAPFLNLMPVCAGCGQTWDTGKRLGHPLKRCRVCLASAGTFCSANCEGKGREAHVGHHLALVLPSKDLPPWDSAYVLAL